jgi:murein DD-endopeptidase MepM/ murein hydrolase activator NlpD
VNYRVAIPATVLVSLLALLLPVTIASAASDYPEVRVLSSDDALYVQLQSELDDFRKIAEAKRPDPPPFPPLSLFEYTKRATDDIFALNARIGLRYDTLATLNGTGNPASFNGTKRILIPSQDGLFVNNPPRGDLENMILSTRTSDRKMPQALQVTRNGHRESLLFFPGESFSGMERAYFLSILYRTPIEKGRVTSMYGWRSDPFTGAREFHGGLDIGAADGTPVHAAREGTVDEIGKSDILGNYIVLSHPGGYQTVYGHLSAVGVTIHTQVSTGAIIGAVGHTGRVTGPHLHFEIRSRSGTRDPLQLIRMK